MEDQYRYKCRDCGHTWRQEDYETLDATPQELDYKDGFTCPQCGSEDIQGKPI